MKIWVIFFFLVFDTHIFSHFTDIIRLKIYVPARTYNFFYSYIWVKDAKIALSLIRLIAFAKEIIDYILTSYARRNKKLDIKIREVQ